MICMVFIHDTLEAQNNSNERLLDSILFLAKENSINSGKSDWLAISEKVKATLNLKDTTLYALVKPTQLLLRELNDFHGALLIDGNRFTGNIQNDTKPNYSADYTISTKLYEKSLLGYRIETSMLAKQIGYIEIPAININAAQDAILLATNAVRDHLCELLSNKPLKLIIDLRTNIGGNMYPMLSGLGLLFPSMELGGDTKDGESFYTNWELKEGNLFLGNYQMTSITLNCEYENQIEEYVVLTSRYTSSSGEAVASSLKGQQHITLVGEQTSGYSSTNSWFHISENIIFSPAIAYYMSVDKTSHKNGIVPDLEIIEELNLLQLKSGKIIEKAIEILK